ncbi:cyclase family protein, partial [Bacteroidales bacterium]|nr:cyclase family protein [Bacteroidales bacterium]
MRGVNISPAKTIEKDGWNASTLELYSHAGTHMDAPYHFGVSNETIDEVNLNQCMGSAWVIDATSAGDKGLITLDYISEIIQSYEEGDFLIFCTGWSQYFMDTEKYRNDLPRISEELALWCVENKVGLIGVEPPSVADVNNKEELTNIHRILLGGNIVIVEGLTNLENLRGQKVNFMALPLKVKDGDGAPCRAVAVID